MKAKEFNERWQTGQKKAGGRLPALRAKYEAALRANARRTRKNYEGAMTAAAVPKDDPSSLLDESALKVAVTARTAAERKRMAAAVAQSLIGKQKATFFDATLMTIATAQAEAATKAVRDALTKVIGDSLTEGWTVPETAVAIETTLTEYASWEAERLARTDLVGISNAISLRSAETLGDLAPPFKRWLSAGDENVRPTHQDANGQTVEMGKTFDVGGFPMDHPGDFLAPYAETMNCRCTQVYLDTAAASTAHSFEGGIVEDAIALAASGDDPFFEDLIAAMAEPVKDPERVTNCLEQVYRMDEETRERLMNEFGSEPAVEEIVAAAVDFSGGTMIALYPEGADRLAIPGGQTESDLHITLCFLPNGVDGNRDELVGFLADIAALTPVLEGEVGGMGFFSPGEDGMPAIALPDVVGLNELRTAVAAALEATGTSYSDVHGFLPHITILYLNEDSPAAETYDQTGMPLRFPALVLKEGQMAMTFAFSAEEEADPEEALDASAEPDDEPEPEAPEAAPVAAIVAEAESLHKGRPTEMRRMAPSLPTVYDGLLAAREAGLRGLTSSAAPIAPPDEWFADPQLEAPTPLTITPEGRVFGHLGEWGKCHTGIGGRCVMIPRSSTGYADFHNGGLVLASGYEIRVGKLTLDTGHAPLSGGASRAAAHYDHTGHVGAFVRAGEDEFGPWLAGAVRSDATPEQVRDLRANPPSGDWRKLAGRNGLELIAALAVPVQGFPVAALAASGEVTGFISGWGDTEALALVASAEVEDMEREFEILLARLDGLDGLADLVSAGNPYHDKIGRFDFGAADRARAAKAERNTHELDDPPVMPQRELDRVDAPGLYGDHGFAEGERVRTPEGYAGTVKSSETYSGSQVPVVRDVDGEVEHHDPASLRRIGSRAALPPRDAGNMTAAAVRITIEVDDEDDVPTDALDPEVDREIGLQVDFFRDHGYWPPDPLSTEQLTAAQFVQAQKLASTMNENPGSRTSIALRDRLIHNGLVVS